MNAQNNAQPINYLNQTISNNCMSTINAYIEYSSSNCNINKEIYNIDEFDSGKLKLNKYQNRKITIEEIQAIYFDKTIFSIIGEKKMKISDYLYLLYIFFVRETFRSFSIQLGRKNISKFFKKFFNSCKKSNILDKYDIAKYIDCYMLFLYQLITGSKNENDITKLKEKPIINLQDLDSVDKKYMKLLVKYILAFCNILEFTKEYKNYPNIIFTSFSTIKDTFFYKFFMKQLNNIYLNKGLYAHGQKFIQNIFNSIIFDDNKKSIYNFNNFSSYLINSVLHYKYNFYPKNNNNTNTNRSNISYKNGSPFYFMNLFILIHILNNMEIKKDSVQKIDFKFIDFFNKEINLFIDDENKLHIAECLLIDSNNGKLILKLLDIYKIIHHYLTNDEQKTDKMENKNKTYFEYLFFDLTINKYSINNVDLNDKKVNINIKNNNCPIASTSNVKKVNNGNNNPNEYSEKEYCKIIKNKFNNSKDYFIKKYIVNDNNENNNNNKRNDKSKNKSSTKNIDVNEDEDIEKIISEKTIVDLFILLDMLYNISINYSEETKKKSILDIKKIIKYIIIKSFEEKQFNCTIFNFMLNVDQKYLPLSSEFNIINCNEILMNKSFPLFIKTYPIYLIFIINYFPKSNLEIYISIFLNFTKIYDRLL